MSVPEIVGLAGVALMLIAYAGIATGRLVNTSPALHAMNLVGALAVLYSLMFDWNLPAFCIECAWACIAAWGLLRALRQRRHS